MTTIAPLITRRFARESRNAGVIGVFSVALTFSDIEKPHYGNVSADSKIQIPRYVFAILLDTLVRYILIVSLANQSARNYYTRDKIRETRVIMLFRSLQQKRKLLTQLESFAA